MGERRRWLYMIAGIFVCANVMITLAGWLTIQFYHRVEDNALRTEEKPAETLLQNEQLTVPLYEYVPRTVDPLQSPNDATKQVVSLVCEPLAIKQTDGTLSGLLAERWDISQDRKQLTVYLRNNVRWHDGEPFTAADVHYTYAQLANQWGHLDRITSDANNQQLIFSFNEPLSDVADFLSVHIVPRHVYEKAKQEDRPLIGTGPYQMEKRSAQDVIILSPNESYWDKNVRLFRKITLHTVSAEEAVSKFVGGEIDILPQIDPITAHGVLSESVQMTPYTRLARQQGHVYHYILFNRAKPTWNNKRLRHAMGAVLDKHRMIEESLYGYGTAIDTPRGTIMEHITSEEVFEAKKLLQNELGKKNITLHYSSKWVDREKIAQLMHQMWQDAGVNVERVQHDDLKQVMAALKTGKADIVLLSEVVQNDARQLYDWWQNSPLKNWRNWPGQNLVTHLKTINRTENPAIRATLLSEWDERFINEAPFIPLFAPDTLYFASTRLGENTIRNDRFFVRECAVQ